MPTTLEMPAAEELGSTNGSHDSHGSNGHTAEAAADLIEQGESQPEAEGEPEPLPQAEAATEEPAKPKRGRKKKQPKSELDQDHPFDTNAPTGEAPADAVPVPIGEPLPPKPPATPPFVVPPVSRSTRLIQIANIERDYIEVTLEINEHENTIDHAKAEIKRLSEQQRELATELRHLRNDDQFQPRLPLVEGEPAGTQADARPPAESPQGDARPAAAAPDADAWRKVSINKLGLSPKLEDKLVDVGCINIGLLEELRAEISQGRAKWPKGVGAARITEIENAVVEWLSKNRDAAAFAELTAATHESVPTAGQWESMTDDQRRDYIARRADAINDGTPNCLDRKHADSSQYWDRGHIDFREEAELRDCIYLPGVEMDDWIRGWLSAGVVEEYEPSEVRPAKPAPPVGMYNLDEI